MAFMSGHVQPPHGTTIAEPLHLDNEHRQKLAAIAALRATSLDAALNEIIDLAFATVDRQARLQAVQRIAELSLEVIPDPQVLAKDLDEAHAFPDLS
jgi:hypothetical protein